MTDALVLRTVEFAQSDLVVHLLTPDRGRWAAIAKGARRSKKRFPGALDLFHLVRLHADRRPGRMARLDGAVLLDAHAALRRDPVRFAIGCTLLELMGRLAPEGAAPPDARRLFAFALDALRTIASSKPDARLRLWIELRALDALGLRPEFRCCVRCGDALRASERVGFLIADGGPVCGACGVCLDGLLPVHQGTLRALEQSLCFELARLPRLVLTPAALDEARTLVTRFTRFHLGVELRSERFLDEIMRDGARPAA